MQKLYDSNMRLLGSVEMRADGRQELRDSNHNLLGYYDPDSGKTYDSNRKLIGKGNLLTALLEPSE